MDRRVTPVPGAVRVAAREADDRPESDAKSVAAAAPHAPPAVDDEPRANGAHAHAADAPQEPPVALHATSATPLRSTLRKLASVGALATILGAQYASQNILAPNLTAVAKEFGFDAKQRDRLLGGYISLAMYLTGGFSALLSGAAGDLLPRRTLLVAVILVSEVACLLTYWAATFNQLLAGRALVGMALGAAPPLVYSCLADVFGPGGRAMATAAMTVAASGGSLIGQVIAGYLGTAYNWRVPFLVVSAPCLLIALLLPLLTREPRRGDAEPAILLRRQSSMTAALLPASGGDADVAAAPAGAEETCADTDTEAPPDPAAPKPPPPPPPAAPDADSLVYAERLSFAKLLAVLRVPTNLLIFAQTFPASIPWGVMGVFSVDYVAQDRHMGVRAAVNSLLLFAGGGLLGTLGGNALIALLRQRHGRPGKRALGMLAGACTFGGIGPVWHVLKGGYSPQRFGSLGAAAFGAGFLCYVTVPAIRTALLNVNAPETRGSAYSVYVFLDFLGRSTGPLAVANLAAQKGRTAAFTDCVLIWCVSGSLLFGLVWSLPQDEDKLHERMMRARLEDARAAAGDADGSGGDALTRLRGRTPAGGAA